MASRRTDGHAMSGLKGRGGDEDDDGTTAAQKLQQWQEKLEVAAYFHILTAVHIQWVVRVVWGGALLCAVVLSSLQLCTLGNAKGQSCGSETVRHALAVAVLFFCFLGLAASYFGNYRMPRACDHVTTAQMHMTLANVVQTWRVSDDFWADILYKIDTEMNEQDPALPSYVLWRHRRLFRVDAAARQGAHP